MSEPMLAQIMIFGGNYAPRGWTFCQGQLMSVMDFQALYSLLNTYYGGDGRSTFGVPDLRGRVALGLGAGPGRTPRNLGQFGGFERIKLPISQMPAHSHLLNFALTGDIVSSMKCNNTTIAGGQDPEGNYLGKTSGTTKPYTSDSGSLVNMGEDCIETRNDLELEGSAEATGGDSSHENMPPWLTLNYIMATEGYYPSRS